jgi:hypothetical protein
MDVVKDVGVGVGVGACCSNYRRMLIYGRTDRLTDVCDVVKR